MPYRRKSKPYIDHNPDPARFSLVKRRDGMHLQAKWGTITDKTGYVPKNGICTQSKITSPAAVRVRDRMGTLIHGISCGDVSNRMGPKLRSAYREKGYFDFSYLNNFDFQKYNPFYRLSNAPCNVEVVGDEIQFTISVYPQSVNKLNTLVKTFYYDVAVLWGDPGIPGDLRIAEKVSAVFDFESQYKGECLLSLNLPDRVGPWMAMLKLSCLEENRLSNASCHYGLKVVKTGFIGKYEDDYLPDYWQHVKK
jgi:hypothetical protein